jgi:hypothetical protein
LLVSVHLHGEAEGEVSAQVVFWEVMIKHGPVPNKIPKTSSFNSSNLTILSPQTVEEGNLCSSLLCCYFPKTFHIRQSSVVAIGHAFVSMLLTLFLLPVAFFFKRSQFFSKQC